MDMSPPSSPNRTSAMSCGRMPRARRYLCTLLTRLCMTTAGWRHALHCGGVSPSFSSDEQSVERIEHSGIVPLVLRTESKKSLRCFRVALISTGGRICMLSSCTVAATRRRLPSEVLLEIAADIRRNCSGVNRTILLDGDESADDGCKRKRRL